MEARVEYLGYPDYWQGRECGAHLLHAMVPTDATRADVVDAVVDDYYGTEPEDFPSLNPVELARATEEALDDGKDPEAPMFPGYRDEGEMVDVVIEVLL